MSPEQLVLSLGDKAKMQQALPPLRATLEANGTYWKMVRRVWESPGGVGDVCLWRQLLTGSPRSMMNDEELARLASFDDPLLVYRGWVGGDGWDNRDGISWTPNLDLARKYANLKAATCGVVRGNISVSDVIAFIVTNLDVDGLSEEEILAFPEDVADKRDVP